jgi:hypothetical protein
MRANAATLEAPPDRGNGMAQASGNGADSEPPRFSSEHVMELSAVEQYRANVRLLVLGDL